MIQLSLKTLTPLWTGGVDAGKMDRIHEASIIGSLRWWDEAILRGLGQRVCDPTSDRDRCPANDGSYCDVCKLYGATGRGRRFRLRIQGGDEIFDINPNAIRQKANQIPLPSGRLHETRTGWRAGGWFLQGGARMDDDVIIRFIPLDQPDSLKRLRVSLSVIARYAAIGAKVSNGYGVVSLAENGSPLTMEEHLVNQLPASANPNTSNPLPDIRDFFFAKVLLTPPKNEDWWRGIPTIAEAWEGKVWEDRASDNEEPFYLYDSPEELKLVQNALGNFVKQKKVLPLAPSVRNWLRYKWSSSLSDTQKDYLFGSTSSACPYCIAQKPARDEKNNKNLFCYGCKQSFRKDQVLERLASKINVSHAYQLDDGKWEFRIWGCIPSRLPQQLDLKRDGFFDSLEKVLCDISTWGEVLKIDRRYNKLNVATQWLAPDAGNRDGKAWLKKLSGAN